jgi:DNA-binding protein H-NS
LLRAVIAFLGGNVAVPTTSIYLLLFWQSRKICEYRKFFQDRKALNVARQLAVRTVVEWFGNLSFDQQNDALGQIQDQHAQSRAAKRAELEKQLAALGYSAPKKRGRPRATGNADGNGARVRKGRKGKVKAKYRDPKTSETWSGRGRMASWLKSKQDGGENIEKYLV